MIPRQGPQSMRTFGVVAHVDAGKTTLTERILHATGRIHALGTVDGGSTVTDYDPRERARGITIGAAAVTTRHREHVLTLVDTPGHVDFGIEVERSLRVLDGAVIVLDAVAGVEPQTESVWAQADRFDLPRLVFVNKIDRAGADFDHAVRSVSETFGVRAVPVVIPAPGGAALLDLVREVAIEADARSHDRTRPLSGDEVAIVRRAREQLIEAAADLDPEILEVYLMGRPVSSVDLVRVLRRATIDRSIVLVLAGSAKLGLGVSTLLDAIVAFLPSPSEAASRRAGVAAEAGGLVAFAFKSIHDAFGARVFVRVYAGTLERGASVTLASSGKTARVGRLVRLFGDEVEDVEAVGPGEIAAVLGLAVPTGETLCDKGRVVRLEGLTIPEPVVTIALEPEDADARAKLGAALGRLVADDPSLRLAGNPETGETLLSGLGELHLDVTLAKLREDHGVRIRASAPRVAYRETITRTSEAEGEFIKQKGGPGQYGHVKLRIEPLAPGAGFAFADASMGGVVPKEYVPSVEAGAREAAALGVLGGYPLVDVKVTLLGGSFHEKDSNEHAFAMAARIAFRDAARAAGLAYLEPVMKLDVVTPETKLGDVIADLGGRRGRVTALGTRGAMHTVAARVPLAELFGYANALRSRTQGRASASMQLDGYERVPTEVATRVPAA
ncbi:MAG: elongation factor G [Myxococcales bacterium]|nr:elongation factor G [Myxococcales bacterium]